MSIATKAVALGRPSTIAILDRRTIKFGDRTHLMPYKDSTRSGNDHAYPMTDFRTRLASDCFPGRRRTQLTA